MSDDTDTTRWSLSGQTDVPRDELKIQMEVYAETILLRGFEGGANWVRTVSADAIAKAFTQHLGLSTGILPKETLWWNQCETGQVVALWRPPKVWPVALQREAFKPPARLRVPMPGLVFVCSPGGASQPAAPELLPRGCGPLQKPGPRRPAGAGLRSAHRLLGPCLPRGRLRFLRPPLRRSSPLRQLPAHRLHRQRRRTQGYGSVLAGRAATVAHRRGQRRQLGAGPRRERDRTVAPV